MLFFYTPKPRKFHHDFIYVDERKELLTALKAKYNSEKGEEMPYADYHIRMSERVRKAMKIRKAGAKRQSLFRLLPLGMMAFLLVLLLVIAWFCFR